MPERRQSSLRNAMSGLAFRPKAPASTPSSAPDKKKAPEERSTLYRLPPEIRQQIFEPFCVDWRGKTSNLIKALRLDKQLYSEALEMFYRSNEFLFHAGNKWSFGDMSISAVKTIRKVRILVDQGIMHQGLWEVGLPKEDERVLIPFVPATLQDAKNIREVVLEFCSINGDAKVPTISHGALNYHFNYLLGFERLLRVTLLLPGRIWDSETMVGAQRDLMISNSIRLANSRIGVPARLETVPAYHIDQYGDEAVQIRSPVESRDVWFWQAEEEGYLNPPKPSPPPYSRCQVCTEGSFKFVDRRPS